MASSVTEATGFTRRHSWLLVGLLLLLVLPLYLSPYLALQQMRVAAAAKDGPRLAQYIDFDALRANLKTGVQARLAGRQRNERGEPSPASAMGAAVAGALLGPMVDALITPDSVARLLQGQRPGAAVLPSPSSASAAPLRLETRSAYESPNQFVFSLRPLGEDEGEDEEPIDLVLRRQGLFAWRLVELRLP